MAHTIRICMFNADVPVPIVHAQKASTYGRIFHQILAAAGRQILPNTIIESIDYDVMKGEFPASLADVDAIFVSGSAYSTYDDKEWIRRLDDYIFGVYCSHSKVKIFGSCFGHQLICQSLLKRFGVKIEADPKGWEIGVKEIALHERFRHMLGKNSKCLASQSIPKKMRLQFVHHDHVVIPNPEILPSSWVMLGSTQHCAVQGVYEPGRILTFQGHFEFDRLVNSETIKFFFPTWAPEVLKETLEAIDSEDDAISAAEIVLRFLAEKSMDECAATHAIDDGLFTQPLQPCMCEVVCNAN
ncbi:class I glutamine amidotransferase-like protein [Pyrenochaeta sp. MPI-SDFR-AT-0127]|nr:class I glutamine amidotransferase-like protein [Pyrenochaeta sp. MPI-SDFR-AT-0127]